MICVKYVLMKANKNLLKQPVIIISVLIALNNCLKVIIIKIVQYVEEKIVLIFNNLIKIKMIIIFLIILKNMMKVLIHI